MKKINIAVFASGNGTNAEEIFKYFKDHSDISVNAVFTNNPKAGVIERADRHHVPCYTFGKQEFSNSEWMLGLLKQEGIDAIVLAGFLWLVPTYLIDRYPDRIINIHPALLPKFGGKGMYGMNVHNAVLAAGEKESGITIHLVNPKYDEGQIVFQEKCEIVASETPDSLAGKIHVLEHKFYPRVVENWLMGK